MAEQRDARAVRRMRDDDGMHQDFSYFLASTHRSCKLGDGRGVVQLLHVNVYSLLASPGFARCWGERPLGPRALSQPSSNLYTMAIRILAK